MTTFKSILRGLGAPVRGGAARLEIEDELQFHIEMRTRDNIAAGMSPEDAVADAMRRFGDLEHIRAVCEDIRRERLAGVMKMAKGLIWIMLGCGLTLKLAAQVDGMRLVGHFLILIAILWRLLIHLREMQPDMRRIMAAEQPAPSVIHSIDLSVGGLAENTSRSVPAYDEDGRTPVERLISDESSGSTTK
ncbi:MAG TPA: permease prefix domain 1-containing protein [Blastocatellia bacterium]|jgi:hypothetical protein|nr:permease prefix domain 1-containing protein [Blastocatellia bacterium]